MEGFDVLGAVEFEEYIVGAVIPDEKPVVRKLSRASSKANTAASKLSRLKSPKAQRAAQKLRAHASAAVTKGQKLSAAVARARSKAAATLAKPEAKPFVAQAAARAAQYAERTSPAVVVVPVQTAPMRYSRVAAPLRTTASAPNRSMQTARAVAPTSAVRRGAAVVPSKGVSVLGLSEFQLRQVSNWVGPMLDVINAFANAIDDASVAAEVWAQTEPLTLQFETSSPSHPLLSDGYAIQDRANKIIESVEIPPDPPAGDEVGGYWVGETSYAGSSLQVDAIAWIRAARIALGQFGTPVAVVAVPVSVEPPASSAAPEMPPMNQSGGGGGGGGGGSSGGGEEEGGGGEEEGAPAEEASAPSEDEEEGGEGMANYAADGSYQEEGEEDAEYASDEDAPSDEYSEDEEAAEASALEALSLIGHRGGRGGGGGGGGGRAGHHGGHHHHGHRGMRPYYGPMYGVPYYYDNSGYDVFLEEDDEDLADKIVKKIAQREWIESQHTQLGAYDIQQVRRQLGTLKQVTVAIARAMTRNAQKVCVETISIAQGGFFQNALPIVETLKKTQGKLQWHADKLASLTDPMAIYDSSNDLIKWTVQAFIDANAVEEGRATQEVIWNAMWTEIAAELAKMPPKIVAAIVKLPGQALEAVTGVPAWAWWVGGGVLVFGLGFGIYKIAMAAAPAVASTVVKRYLP